MTVGSLGHFLNIFYSHIQSYILKALSITSILHFKFSSYSISFKSYGALKLCEMGLLRDKMPYLLPLSPWRENKTFFNVFFCKFLLSFGLNSPILIRFSVKVAEIIRD